MTEPSASGQRAPRVLAFVAVALTVAVLPVAGRRLGPTTSFVPAVLAAVACFDVTSVWLLTGEYLDTGHRRHLRMAMAYLWSLLLMTGYGLAFPGAVSGSPPLETAASVAPYLYIGWHAGFPVLLGAAWAPWSGGVDEGESRTRRRTRMVLTLGTTMAAAVGVIAGVVLSIRHLPVLIHGLDTTQMTKVTAPVALPLVVAALEVTRRGVRGRTGPERWTFVAVLVCFCDLCLTYTARYRYSAGWYLGRSLTVTAAAVVLIAMLAAFRRLKATAERDAALDHLTQLPNRRSAYETLARMIARSRRDGSPLTVVMLDLDHFKAVNDQHGHQVGDAVLRASAATLRMTLRLADVVARVGGEEFLVLLPDAGDATGLAVAERLRIALAAMDASLTGSPVTASMGVATLASEDADVDSVVRRADRALYQAKSLGRDRSCLASREVPAVPGPRRPPSVAVAVESSRA